MRAYAVDGPGCQVVWARNAPQIQYGFAAGFAAGLQLTSDIFALHQAGGFAAQILTEFDEHLVEGGEDRGIGPGSRRGLGKAIYLSRSLSLSG